MAKAKSAQVAQAAATLNMISLAAVAVATMANPQAGFAMVTKADADALAAAGLVKTDPSGTLDANGQIACQATDAGIKAYTESQPATVHPANNSAAATNTAGETAGSYDVFDVPLPDDLPKQRAGKKSTYPFDTMDVNKAFFVPATAERPEPWKTMASTIASARERFAVDTGTTKQVTRKGETKTVPVKRYERDFSVREIQDAGKYFGPKFAGQKGAGIWRVK